MDTTQFDPQDTHPTWVPATSWGVCVCVWSFWLACLTRKGYPRETPQPYESQSGERFHRFGGEGGKRANRHDVGPCTWWIQSLLLTWDCSSHAFCLGHLLVLKRSALSSGKNACRTILVRTVCRGIQHLSSLELAGAPLRGTLEALCDLTKGAFLFFGRGVPPKQTLKIAIFSLIAVGFSNREPVADMTSCSGCMSLVRA